nr:recombinase family protein [uncultured Ruminococcus sp.]
MRYDTYEQPEQVLRTYKAALYIRLSREDGDKPESDSVVNQKRILDNFIAAQPDIGLVDYYVDDGYSGANFDRPSFLHMMADIYARKVDCVIVKDSSRFGRNASESGRYIGEIFPRLQVRFIAVNDLIDSGKSQSIASDFLNVGFRGLLNEYYLAANSESIRSTLNMERRKGEFIGSFAKFGYQKDPTDRHKLLIDEPAAEVIRKIYSLYLSGVGIRGIVRRLNERGIPNPSTYKRMQGLNFKARTVGDSSLWCDKTVRRILRDEMYIGTMVQGKNKKINYKSKAIRSCVPDEWIRVEGTHEPIISKDNFDRVQKMLNTGVKGTVQSGNIDLFAGLLKCAGCGHALIKKTNHNSDKTYVYYRCSTHCKCKTACTAHTIRYERLYYCVLYCIRQMVDAAVNADEVIHRMEENRVKDLDEGLNKQLDKQEQELEKVLQRMADLYPDFKDGTINADQYRIMKEKYEQAQKDLTKSIEKLKESLDRSDGDHVATNDFIEHFKKHGNIKSLTRPILTELIDRIVVHMDGTLDITFNFCDTFADLQDQTRKKSA